MAVTTTALGFKKPDGLELVRGGDNVIADNAQTAQDLIAGAQSAASALTGRVNTAEAKNATQDATLNSHGGRLSYVEAALAAGGGGGGEPGAGATFTPDPDNPGLYFLV